MNRMCRSMPTLVSVTVGSLALGSIAFGNRDDLITDRRDDDLITTRRDDDLIEPLDPKPAPSTLMRDVESAGDRGDGRLQDEAMDELDRLEREVHGERLFDELERERDRQLFIDAQQRKAATNAPRPRLFERESDRLGAARRDYLSSIGRANDTASAGAADDSKKLRKLQKSYEHDLKKLKSDAERDQRREQYELDRARILGVDPTTIQHDLTSQRTPPTTAPSTHPSQ